MIDGRFVRAEEIDDGLDRVEETGGRFDRVEERSPVEEETSLDAAAAVAAGRVEEIGAGQKKDRHKSRQQKQKQQHQDRCCLGVVAAIESGMKAAAIPRPSRRRPPSLFVCASAASFAPHLDRGPNDPLARVDSYIAAICAGF